MAISNIKNASNLDIWNALQSEYPNFANNTAKATADLFSERGWEMLKSRPDNLIDDFFNLSIRTVLQFVKIAEVKNPLSESGLVEYFSTPMGGLLQRIYVGTMKPISPRFLNLQDGTSVDPYVIRKNKNISESFARQSYAFQNILTLSEYDKKTIFLDANGMGQFLSGIIAQLQNSYTVQEYNNVMECLSHMIDSTTYPLKDTQKLTVVMADKENPTNDELLTFINGMKDLASSMEVVPSTGAYNAASFESVARPTDMVMLVRPTVLNRIQTQLTVGAFNPDMLTLPFKIQAVANFGGLIPYKEAAFTTPLYPVYDAKFGDVIGYNEAEDQTEVTVQEKDVFWKDPHEDVIAVIAQKGAIFINTQDGVAVDTLFNPVGRYTQYIMSQANVTICGDYHYNLVTVTATGA